MITVFYCPECGKEIEDSMECEDCEVKLESSEKCTECGSYDIELVQSGDYPALRCEDCGWTTINMFEDSEGEDYETAVERYKEKMDEYNLVDSRGLEDSYQINEITITELLRVIKPEKLDAEEIESERYPLRTSTHKMKTEDGENYYLHRDGISRSGNYVTFPEDFDEEKKFEIIQELFMIVLERKTEDLEVNFSGEQLGDLEINTPEGFLFEELEEDEKEEYILTYTDILKEIIDQFRDVDTVEDIKDAVKHYRERKSNDLDPML